MYCICNNQYDSNINVAIEYIYPTQYIHPIERYEP